MGFKFEFRKKGQEEFVPDDPPPSTKLAPDGPELVWCGHLTDYSGYAKANREILFRVANVFKINVLKTGLEHGLISVDKHTRARVDVHRDVHVNERAPLLRFFGPDYVGDGKRHRVCWTMMETYKIHHDMVHCVNKSFDELWTPTEWNRQVFVESGVKIPTRAMPLGVNPSIYRPIPKAKLPACRLLTTDMAGTLGHPEGFIFLSVGLPSFRKGFDVLVEAFGKAFSGKKDVHLVLGITHSIPEWNAQVYKQFSGKNLRIWTLEGQYSEHEMAKIYSATNCYVTASRGEGWNLPVCEAAACGVPVIAPDNTSHAEVLQGGGLLFPVEGYAQHEEANKVSKWYQGMPFAVFGQKSVDGLAQAMKAVVQNGPDVKHRMERLRTVMTMRWTWDRAANMVIDRLLEVQP
jgi:glycosyltransferase involved in cell wall biosynthesis